MENKPSWLDEYDRAYPAGLVARYVTRPPKPDSYTMFTRLIEVVQTQQTQIQELTDRVKTIESRG